MDAFVLKEILPDRLHVLSNMLQLYAHDMNESFRYSIVLDDNGRYRIKPAEKYLSEGWGYFIIVRCEYAGFILLNHQTRTREGTFIAEFYILPRFRRGFFYRDVIATLLSVLDGIVEFRVLKNNKLALLLFDDLAKKYLSVIQRTDVYENGSECILYSFNTANIIYDISKYKGHIRPAGRA